MDASDFIENNGVKLPQPVDYGLTHDEVFNDLFVKPGQYRGELPECGFGKFKYKEGERVKFFNWKAVAIWFVLYTTWCLITAMLSPRGLALSECFFGMLCSAFLILPICVILENVAHSQLRKNPSPEMLAFRKRWPNTSDMSCCGGKSCWRRRRTGKR